MIDSERSTQTRVRVDSGTDGRLRPSMIPTHHISAWGEVDAIVPLRPRPLRLRSWAAADRAAAAAALGLVTLIALLMVRPLSWAGLGGEQSMPAVATLPRSYVMFVPVAMAICSWLLLRLMAASRHWARFLGIAGLTTLAVEAGARLHIEASTLIGHGPLPPAAMKVAQGLGLCGVWAEILALVAGVLATRAARPRARWTGLAPWLMAAAFLLPLVAYIWSLTLPSAVASRLVALEPSLGVTASASSTIAYAIFQPYVGLIYMSAALAAWQAVTFVQAITEAGPRAARVLHRSITARTHSLRARGALLLLCVLAAAKLAFDVAGYSHRLPSTLGGGAAIWSQGQNPLVWWYTVLVVLPIAVLLLRRLRYEHTRLSLTAPLVLLSMLFALLGPVQILAQALSDFDPAGALRDARARPHPDGALRCGCAPAGGVRSAVGRERAELARTPPTVSGDARALRHGRVAAHRGGSGVDQRPLRPGVQQLRGGRSDIPRVGSPADRTPTPRAVVLAGVRARAHKGAPKQWLEHRTARARGTWWVLPAPPRLHSRSRWVTSRPIARARSAKPRSPASVPRSPVASLNTLSPFAYAHRKWRDSSLGPRSRTYFPPSRGPRASTTGSRRAHVARRYAA